MNDLVRLAAERAVVAFGGRSDATFCGACFSGELCAMAGVKGPIDGNIIRAILTGRDDIEVLSGGSHYRIRSHT